MSDLVMYIRVHGEKKVSRRDIKITDWKKNKAELVEDFSNICGYCGKDFEATFCDSQIDHFVPKKKYPDYENVYSNLVLACKTCNNKKKQDWPSNDPLLPISLQEEGYIDPACEVFDQHFKRSLDGEIIAESPTARYMNKRLGFATRPISMCWKIHLLYECIKKLRAKQECEILDIQEIYEMNKLLISLEDLRKSIKYLKE